MITMNIETLQRKYKRGEQTPEQTVETVFKRINTAETNIWISIRKKEAVLADIEHLSDLSEQPLYGIPFAIKDNIDYTELPTTAACPKYAYEPNQNATVVNKLLDAGALLIGKTNMDQFATGLVGTRSPYGICKNYHNEEYISGGSSSGSALAVARGEVAFALGTDTAGSGRVPAAFNSVVGLKPSRGMISTNGVLPACASLDCVSIFANSCREAIQIESITAGYDTNDPYSNQLASTTDLSIKSKQATDHVVGLPDSQYIEFFGDDEAARLYDEACRMIKQTFPKTQVVNFEPFIKTAELLYQGPWLAERLESVHEFVSNNAEAVHPVVKKILIDGKEYSAMEAFRGFHRLAELKQEASQVMEEIDALVTPTTGTAFTIEEVLEKPIERNSQLGYYTNYVNLLDLSAVAVPTGRFDSGAGFGVTVLGSKGSDAIVSAVGQHIRDMNEKEESKAVRQ